MKKIISFVLCIMCIAMFILPTAAVDDAAVNYVLSVRASEPDGEDTYSIGQTVKITVCVKDIIGTQTPPIYGLNGVLNYDSFLLKLTDVSVPKSFERMKFSSSSSNKIAFSYLCGISDGTLRPTTVRAEFDLVTFEFEAQRDGISRISLSDFIITNFDASERLISSSDAGVDIKIGTGVQSGDADALKRDIDNAKKELAAAVLNPTTNLVYPAFTVSAETYNALDAAIKKAEAALETAGSDSEFLAAQKELAAALYTYEVCKMYGEKPSSSGSDDLADIIEGLISGGVIPGGSSSKEETKLIEVTAVAGENGKIEEGYESQLVRHGTSVTVKAVPNDGYIVDKVTVNGVEYPGDTLVTIAKVTNKTVVEFSFAKAPRFTDVPKGEWYYDAVQKIVEMGLFNGTSETEFSPTMPMTRAMLVTVLHRLDGKSEVIGTANFSDVEDGQWYSDAIAWASANGIVKGYGGDIFGTNDNVSRQDMVTILYRYLAYKGGTPIEGKELSAFTDADQVSDYARPALEWAYAAGLVNGTSVTTLSPRDNSTRAQVATVILRYIENVK